jgi:uncharacterized OsmC-like protein
VAEVLIRSLSGLTHQTAAGTHEFIGDERITRQLTLHGELGEEQQARVAEIAERCQVQRTLQREIAIEQRLAPSSV